MSTVAASHGDRHPGDAEADAAVAAMRCDTWFRTGDVVRFTDPDRGFYLEPATVLGAMTAGQLLVQTFAGRMELVISESQVIVWECA